MPKAPYGQDMSFDDDREQMHRRLFSAVSHDLKTPLASMIGSLEIHQRMKDRLSEEKREALISTALQEAYRLDNFVTNILDMGKLESGMVKLRKEKVDIGQLVRDCITNMDNRLKHCNLEVEAVAGPILASTAPSLLSRALSLILDNAVKYSGSHPHITLRYWKEGDVVLLSVRDNGRGVPEDQYEKIFEKYTRFVRSDQQNAGTGLGLPICREIMRVLGGAVVVSAPQDKQGAVFTLRFPVE